jgi:hypothetical protein
MLFSVIFRSYARKHPPDWDGQHEVRGEFESGRAFHDID